jgi:hypothetical protein
MFVPNLPSVAKRKRALDEEDPEPSKLLPRRDSVKLDVKPSSEELHGHSHTNSQGQGLEESDEEGDEERVSIRDLMKNTRAGKPTKAALERIVRSI